MTLSLTTAMPPSGESLPELLSFLDSQPEPRIIMDANYQIVAANRAYSEQFGQQRPVTGRRCYEVSHHFTVPCDQAGETCPLRLSQESGESRRVLHLHHTPRGEENPKKPRTWRYLQEIATLLSALAARPHTAC